MHDSVIPRQPWANVLWWCSLTVNEMLLRGVDRLNSGEGHIASPAQSGVDERDVVVAGSAKWRGYRQKD